MIDAKNLETDSVFNRPKINVLPPHIERIIDLELSNHCNAACYYCPRDLVTETGFMAEDTFKTIIDQVSVYPQKIELLACGHGESLLHPKVAEFIAYARSKNLAFGLQTNGSPLTPERRRALLDAGLTTLRLSVSAIGDLHEQMYRLKFDTVLKNIKSFIAEARGSCSVGIFIVQTDLNRMHIKDYKTFWEDVGVDHCVVLPVHNRSGSLPFKNVIYTNHIDYARSEKIVSDESFSNLCFVALMSDFIGYDGNHYLCPNDWEKKISIGHVNKLSLSEALHLKAEILNNRTASICDTCDMNIHNRVKGCLGSNNSDELIHQLIENRHNEENFMQKLLSADVGKPE